MAPKKKEALLVIDMLNDFVLEGAPLEVPSNRDILPTLKREIDSARAKKTPVIYICDAHVKNDPEFRKMGWPPHALRGTVGAEVVEPVKPRKGDYIVKKTTYSGFFKTRLHALLQRLNIRKVKLTGCVTNICVLYTASEAVLRGYEVSVKENCVAGLSPQTHRFSLQQMRDVLGAKIV